MSPRTRLAVAAVAVLASSAAVISAHAGSGPAGARAVADSVTQSKVDPDAVLPAATTPTPAWAGYARKPNILMITSDDLAVGDLAYMPHVRRLLQNQGVTFTNAVAPTPICVPARASLLSGQYAHNHGARTISGPHGGYRAFNERRTLPVALRRAGYDTLFSGKFLNGYGQHGSLHDVPRGWTDWRGTVDPSTYLFYSPTINHNGRLTTYHRYTTSVMSEQANDMLRRNRRKHHRWFMWVNYVAPHFGGPWESGDPTRIYRNTPAGNVKTTVPAPRDRGRYAGKRLPRLPYYFTVPTGAPRHSAARLHHWTKKERKALRIAYDQRLEAARGVDRAVASQIRVLRRTHQLKNTIVIFGGDNGYTTGGHNINGKLWQYDEVLRIPLVMRGPGIPQGTKVATAVTNPDIATTILAAAGATPLRPQDGVNILPWLRAPTQDRVVPIEGWQVYNGNRKLYAGVRTARWTYVRYRRGGEELYDRRSDPYELHSLAEKPAYRSQLKQLRALTRTYHDCRGASCPKAFYRA